MKLWLLSIVGLLCFCCGVTPCFASAITEYGTTFPLGDGTAGDGTEKSIDFGNIIKKEAIDKESSASERIQQALGVNYSAGEAKEQRATFYIKQLINRFLAIIGLVATVVLIYGFYKMFSESDNAAGFEDAIKIVKGAIFALFVIGISRYLVSILFDIFFAAKEDI